MATMRRAKVRRLPVVSDEGKLVGIVALNDLILVANRRRGAISYEDVVGTMKVVSEHRVPRPAEVDGTMKSRSMLAAAASTAHIG
jgi:CBS domain-containing protein